MKTYGITSYITPKTTGYSAFAGVVLATCSGVSKNKNLKKYHKPFAIFTALSTIVHVGIIEYLHHKYNSHKANKPTGFEGQGNA